MKIILLCFLGVGLNCCRTTDLASEVKLLDAEETFENSEVGYLAHNRSPEEAFCTATLIAPHIVITAAHCSPDENLMRNYSGPVEGELIFVVQKSKTKSFKYRIDQAKSFAVDSGSESDFALMTLHRSVPSAVAEPATIAANPPPQKTPSKSFGYGCTGHALNSDTNEMTTTGQSGIKRMIKQSVGDHRYQGCPGDSGGPSMIVTTREIYAITASQKITDADGKPVSDEFRRTHDNGGNGDWGEFCDITKYNSQIKLSISQSSPPKDPAGVELRLIQGNLTVRESPNLSATGTVLSRSLGVITGIKKVHGESEDWWEVDVVTRGADTNHGFMQAKYLEPL